MNNQVQYNVKDVKGDGGVKEALQYKDVPLRTQTQTRQQIRQPLVCTVRERTISRPGDKKRYKRIVEREKRIKEQQSTVKCNNAVSTVNNGLEVKVY